jgi:molecular chaperone GrpE (heat shock protein)
MTNRPPASVAKWPFILTDVLLLVGFAWVIRFVLPPKTTLDYVAMITIIVFWMITAFIAILPWLKEFQAQVKFAEQDEINSALEQIQRLEEIGSRVQAATGTWQSAQDSANRVTAAAKEVEEKIRASSKEFMEFAERINNDEKQHLRLEVEKLRRNESEWLQVAARMLDHTFAVTAAAHRSGQPNLASQMNNFQNACRDAARRVGLVPFHPAVGDAFEERSQQLEDANAKPEEGAVVSDILATGYTFQGQLLRKALVRVGKQPEPETTQPEPAQQAIVAETPIVEPAPEQSAVEEQTAVAEQAEETRESAPPAEQSRESTDQWERLEQSFEQQQPEAATEASAVEENAGALEEERNAPNESEPGVEVAAAENPAEQPASPEEEKPRRRQRKPDPQASLPF